MHLHSIPPEWNNLFLDLNVTINPIAEIKVSKIVLKDMGSLPQQENEGAFELRTLNDVAWPPALRVIQSPGILKTLQIKMLCWKTEGHGWSNKNVNPSCTTST